MLHVHLCHIHYCNLLTTVYYLQTNAGTSTYNFYCENMGDSASNTMTAMPGDRGVKIDITNGGTIGFPRPDQCGGATSRATTLNVECDVNGQDQLSDFKLTSGSGPQWCELTISAKSRCACVGGCGEAVAAAGPAPAPGSGWDPFPQDGEGGLSNGSIFLICMAVFIPCYCLGGVYINQKRGESGMEAVPHIEFWRDLPGLVSDGCTYFKALVCG